MRLSRKMKMQKNASSSCRKRQGAPSAWTRKEGKGVGACLAKVPPCRARLYRGGGALLAFAPSCHDIYKQLVYENDQKCGFMHAHPGAGRRRLTVTVLPCRARPYRDRPWRNSRRSATRQSRKMKMQRSVSNSCRKRQRARRPATISTSS